MFEYMTVKEAAKQWDISERQVQKLCKAIINMPEIKSALQCL